MIRLSLRASRTFWKNLTHTDGSRGVLVAIQIHLKNDWSRTFREFLSVGSSGWMRYTTQEMRMVIVVMMKKAKSTCLESAYCLRTQDDEDNTPMPAILSSPLPTHPSGDLEHCHLTSQYVVQFNSEGSQPSMLIKLGQVFWKQRLFTRGERTCQKQELRLTGKWQASETAAASNPCNCHE